MQAKDIMTVDVVSIAADTPVNEIAKLLLKHRISGVPVVDDNNHVQGLVSEGDLMRRPENETEQPRSWWLQLMATGREKAADYIKTHGLCAADVMTKNIISVAEDMSVGEVAQLLEKNHIKRAPVIKDGKLVGIISRANLLHSLASYKEKLNVAMVADDRSLRDQILATLRSKDWVSHGTQNVIVNNGAVELWGWVDSEEERKAIVLAVESIPGVQTVENHLSSAPYFQYV